LRLHFLIAAHANAELVVRLCERLLTAPDAGITVQWDCASGALSLPSDLGAEVRTTRAPCEWGNGSQLDALLDSLASLESHEFDWLIVISGQDYPLRPMTDLAEFLTRTPYRLFVETKEAGTADALNSTDEIGKYLRQRYFYQYYWVPQRVWSKLPPTAQRLVGAGLQRAVRGLVRGGALRVYRRPRGFSPGIGVRARRTPFTPERPCRKGSDWFALSRPVFDDLLERVGASPEYVRYFQRTLMPTESFFHTLLLPTWESENAGDNLQYRNFVGQRSHPEILGEQDWEMLIACGEFFARKVDATSAGLLDRLDRERLGL
jgi:hypothetical protein